MAARMALLILAVLSKPHWNGFATFEPFVLKGCVRLELYEPTAQRAKGPVPSTPGLSPRGAILPKRAGSKNQRGPCRQGRTPHGRPQGVTAEIERASFGVRS